MSTHNSQDLIGKKFGRLLVISRIGSDGKGPVYWECVCDCGKKTKAHTGYLNDGRKSSCGCIRSELIRAMRPAKLGGLCAAHKRAHGIWLQMKRRCNNPKSASFKYYGGRGITISPDWMIFKNFINDMGDPPDEMTLDREDSDGPYSKDNCRWASHAEQGRNKRNSIYVLIGGELLSSSQAANKTGLSRAGIYSKVQRGELQRYNKAGDVVQP